MCVQARANVQTLTLWFAFEAMNNTVAASAGAHPVPEVHLWDAALQAVVTKMGSHAIVDVRTLQSWADQLELQGGFLLDARGTWKREVICEQFDVKR